MLYPWQHTVWDALQLSLGAAYDRLPHALAFTGEAGIGKRAFAEHLAASLLCETPAAERQPCGHCPACHWMALGHHPDFRVLQPEAGAADDQEKTGAAGAEEAAPPSPAANLTTATPAVGKGGGRKWIPVDAVRALSDFVQVSSHRGGYRVVLITPAETLNLAAANALLKMLEEPPPQVIFLLVSQRWGVLLPTLRSRCRRWPLPLPAHAEALAWLQTTLEHEERAHDPQKAGADEIPERALPNAVALLAQAGGAPLLAQQMIGQTAIRNALLAALLRADFDPLVEAERLDQGKIPPALVIDGLLRWVYDLARLAQAGSVRYHPQSAALAALAQHLDSRQLAGYQDQLLAARRLAEHPLNTRLVYEELLLGYRRLVQQSASAQRRRSVAGAIPAAGLPTVHASLH